MVAAGCLKKEPTGPMARKKSDLAAMKSRAARSAVVAGGPPAAAPAKPAAPKKPFNPAQFFREVRAEGRKISWTTRRETWITSVFVLIMVLVASMFFFGVDLILSWAVNQLLKIATAG
jgi:preprotein translocase subunit SecE